MKEAGQRRRFRRLCAVGNNTIRLLSRLREGGKGGDYNKPWLNPLHPNISMYILHTVHHTFSKGLTRRICLTIKSCF